MPNDIPYAVPASVSVVFPRPTNVGSYVVAVTLASLDLPEFAGVAGAPCVKVLRDDTPAPDDGGGGATNAAALGDLADQAAEDWYLWQLGRAEARWEGADPWLMEAHTEVVEFRHETGRVSTRTARGPLRDHYAGQLPGPPPGPAYVLVLAAPSGGVPYRGVLSTPVGFAWEDSSAVVDARAINDETLSVGDRYEGRLVGNAADGTPEYRVVATCCPGGSSGSGGGVVTPCCPGVVIPTTLYAVVTGGGVFNGTYTLTYSSDDHKWHYGNPLACCIIFNCAGAGPLWGLSTGAGSVFNNTSAVCSPLQVVFVATSPGPCTSTNGYTVTVTATNPGGGSSCFTGTCPGSVVAHIYRPVGCFASAPSTATLPCVQTGGTYHYATTLGGLVCGDSGMTVTDGSGPPVHRPMLNFGSLITYADAGWDCSGTLDATFDVDDGAGNSCLVVFGSGGTGCGTSTSATLQATITNAMGGCVGSPASFRLTCGGGGTSWINSSAWTCGIGSAQVYLDTGTGLLMAGAGGIGPTAADAGWTLSPVSAVFHMDDGSGDSFTMTVVGT